MAKRFTKKPKVATSETAASGALKFSDRQLNRAKRALRKRRRDKSHQ